MAAPSDGDNARRRIRRSPPTARRDPKIAQNGLEYADDPYDEERYERLLELATEYYGRTLDRPPAELRERLAEEFGPVTPKVGATGAVFDDEGRVLTMKRPGGAWCLPGGNLDAGDGRLSKYDPFTRCLHRLATISRMPTLTLP